jgi:hypothetical protein
MPEAHKFEQLRSCDDPAFDDFYRIYAESISHREQKSRDWICEMVQRSDYDIFLLRRNHQVIGFSMLFLPDSEGFGLLEYMAIATERRNQGLGGELFRRSMDSALRGVKRRVPILLEVDSDREESSDQELRTRRQQFYRRLGCLRLAGLHYILPLAGEGAAPEMDLMVYPADHAGQITKAELERWLTVIYQSVYRCAPDDPRIRQMLTRVPDPVRLD